MADKSESIEGEAKSLAKDVVSSFGLIDLILGGVCLYGLWLLFRPQEINKLFLPTGRDFIDIGLLAFTALLLGKIIYLFSSVIKAIGLLLIEKDKNKAYVQLKESLALHINNLQTDEAKAKVKSEGEKDQTKMAESILTSTVSYSTEIARKRNAISISYGTVLLLLPFVVYICRKIDNIWATLFAVLAVVAFLILGYYQQRALIGYMAVHLISLYLNQQQKAKENRTDTD